MTRRPFIIWIIGLLHILEPVLKLTYFSFVFNEYPWDLIKFEFLTSSSPALFEKFALFPIAGVLILLVNSWSYVTFLLIEMWVFITGIHDLTRSVSLSTPIYNYSIMIFMIINIIVVCYFLFSAVRRPYVDPALRWWEHSPRYSVNWNSSLFLNEGGPIPVLLSNISLSGVFIAFNEKIKNGEIVDLQFSFERDIFKVPVEIVHNFKNGNVDGYGAKFHNLSPIQKKQISMLITTLEDRKFPRRPERIDNFDKVVSRIKEFQFQDLKKSNQKIAVAGKE